MKNLIASLVVILLIGATIWVWAGTPIPGTIVAAKITTGNTDNTFSIGDTIEMLGTCKQVADLTARDAIPAERRAEGMQCWVVSTGLSYRLIGGIANGNWQVTPPVGLPPNALGDLHNDGIGNLSWVPVQGVWSNYQGFIFPAGEPAPDTNGVLIGPSMFFRPDGSLFIGTNVAQNGDVLLPPLNPFNAVSQVDSNEPPFIAWRQAVFDSVAKQSFYSIAFGESRGNKDHSTYKLDLLAGITNGQSGELDIDLAPENPLLTQIRIQTNSVDVFKVNGQGLVVANGFTDNSGTPGSLVAYQGGNRLGATNITAVVENNFFTNISVTNLTVYDSVVVNTNVTIKGNVTVNNITVTNGITNLNLTANSLVETDPNKALKSLANGGANTFLQGTTPPTYTNDVRGAISALPNASLANSSVTVNGTANHITTTSASIALGGSATLDIGANVVTTDTAQTISGNKAQTGSNYIAGAQGMYTNANNTTPDFNVLSSTLSTNANFTWLAPTHIDTTGKVEQWIIVHITNSSGSLITMTAPANVHVCGGGAMNVTNWTEVRWQYYPPSGPTNCWPSPGY